MNNKWYVIRNSDGDIEISDFITAEDEILFECDTRDEALDYENSLD